MSRFPKFLTAWVVALAVFFAPLVKAADTNMSQFFTTTYGNPQIFLSSGTWVSPAPGVSLKIAILAIGGGAGGGAGRSSSGTQGGGGGGGSGRVSYSQQTATANQTVTIGAGGAAGAGGSTTSVGALVSVAGGSAGAAASGSTGGTGGAGGCGGGAGGGLTGGTGGAGSDFIGGGGGGGSTAAGFAGTTTAGNKASPGRLVQSGITGDTGDTVVAGGWPNGGAFSNVDPTAFGGGGGDCTIVLPMLNGRGAGGSGADSNQSVGVNTPQGATAGTAGAVLIWVLPIGS